MGVGAAPPARGSVHTSISAGETADRVPGAPRPDAEPSVREPWELPTRRRSCQLARAVGPADPEVQRLSGGHRLVDGHRGRLRAAVAS
jgi:hypothetical protein